MGGDYGFAWNPHGDYAKELTFFVKHVGFTPLETIKCATKTGASRSSPSRSRDALKVRRLDGENQGELPTVRTAH